MLQAGAACTSSHWQDCESDTAVNCKALKLRKPHEDSNQVASHINRITLDICHMVSLLVRIAAVGMNSITGVRVSCRHDRGIDEQAACICFNRAAAELTLADGVGE
jgi:hypothetical protein